MGSLAIFLHDSFAVGRHKCLKEKIYQDTLIGFYLIDCSCIRKESMDDCFLYKGNNRSYKIFLDVISFRFLIFFGQSYKFCFKGRAYIA